MRSNIPKRNNPNNDKSAEEKCEKGQSCTTLKKRNRKHDSSVKEHLKKDNSEKGKSANDDSRKEES